MFIQKLQINNFNLIKVNFLNVYKYLNNFFFNGLDFIPVMRNYVNQFGNFLAARMGPYIIVYFGEPADVEVSVIREFVHKLRPLASPFTQILLIKNNFLYI